MNRKLTMFDLGCGLGGASAAMRDRGWNVYRVDREHDVKADRYCDIRNLLALPRGVDLLWVSTSCEQFSRWDQPWKHCVARRRPIDVSVELAVKRIIDESCPRFWVVENVRGSRRWLCPIFGPVRSFTGGHVFWGNLPILLPVVPTRKRKMRTFGYEQRKGHLLRSVIPYEISEAIAKTVEKLSSDGGSPSWTTADPGNGRGVGASGAGKSAESGFPIIPKVTKVNPPPSAR